MEKKASKLAILTKGIIKENPNLVLLLGTCHIGEVQVSLWDKETLDACEKAGITLL